MYTFQVLTGSKRTLFKSTFVKEKYPLLAICRRISYPKRVTRDTSSLSKAHLPFYSMLRLHMNTHLYEYPSDPLPPGDLTADRYF
jgi:hypothetical protein